MPKVRLVISIDRDLLTEVRRRARKAGMSSSQYIAVAVQAHLRQEDRDEMKRRISLAHSKETAEDRRIRRAFQLGAAKLLKGTW